MSSESRQQQLSLPEAWERDTRYVMAHDDRVVPERGLCAYCDKPAVHQGMCQRHALEYNEELCGDAQ